MKKYRSKFQRIAEELINLYNDLVDPKGINEIKCVSNIIADRLSFLSQINEGKIKQHQLKNEEAIIFFESLLDGISLQCATGEAKRGVFDPVFLGDPAALGKKKTRKADLKKSDEFISDWHFERLVQASAASQGFNSVIDLKFDNRFKKKGRVCDFLLNRDDHPVELLEIKRVHPAVAKKGNDVKTAANKVIDQLDGAIEQIKNTQAIIKVPKIHKHVLFDVSSYGNEKLQVNIKTFQFA